MKGTSRNTKKTRKNATTFPIDLLELVPSFPALSLL